MVLFYITFMIAIPKNTDKERKSGGKKKSNVGKGLKKKNNLTSGESEDTKKNMFELGKPNFSCHLEYLLIPSYFEYDVDIVCWGEFAKIYTADGARSMRTIIRGQLCWISFSITHSLVLLNDHLEDLHADAVTFKLWPTYKNMPKRAKHDSPKMFFTQENSIQSPFEEVFERPPDNISMGNKLNDLKVKNVGDIITVLSPTPYHDHQPKALEIIEDLLAKAEAQKVEEPDNVGKQKQKNELKKSSKDKIKKKMGKDDGSISMSVNGESFFTGIKQLLCELKEGKPEVCHMLAIITTKDLMTEKQKVDFNPLVINVCKLKGLPADLLMEHRITSIYIKYQFLDMFMSESAYKPMETDMVLNETHAFLTKKVKPIPLLQFLQTECLDIEIYGVQSPTPFPIHPSVFGQEDFDLHLGSKLLSAIPRHNMDNLLTQHPSSTTVLPLAVASFDLSSLLQGCHTVEMTKPVQIWVDNSVDGISKSINPQMINNEVSAPNTNGNPLTNYLLCDSRTRMKVSVKLTSPLRIMLMHALASPQVFNKIFAIVNDMDLAINVINDIFSINQAVLGQCIVVPNYLKECSAITVPEPANNFSQEVIPSWFMEEEEEEEETLAEKLVAERGGYGSPYYCQFALTGFIIDSFDKVMIFVEGQANGQLQRVWNSLMHLPPNKGRVLYNSELVFRTRMYSEFMTNGGIHIVTLCEQLDMKLIKPHTFIRGNIPGPCWRALMKLDLLLKARTMRPAVQKNLFPSTLDLMSLNLEFGVPLRPWMEDVISTFSRSHTTTEFLQ